MQQPPYLKHGSTIGITCPSGYIPGEKVHEAVAVLEQWGFNIKVGDTVGSDKGIYFSDTDEARRRDLQTMLDDPEVDAILMGRGGYGLSRIIDALDFTAFRNKPKWICGFSDVTVLHSHIHTRFGIATLHSPMCGAIKASTAHSAHIINFREAITGMALSYESPASTYNRHGEAEGILTGGNLSLLAHLTGSVSDINTDGKILFLEDTGEYLYNIDRLLLNLKRSGKLDKIAGLIIGSFDHIKESERPFGQTVEEVILDKVKGSSYPVCFGFPCGHEELNFSLSLGMRHKLIVDDRGAGLELLR